MKLGRREIGLGVLLLCGCAQPRPVETRVVQTATNVRRELRVTPLAEPFDTVTVTRVRGALRLHVATKSMCQTDVLRALDEAYSNGRVERGQLELEDSSRGPCAGPSQPAVGVDVGLAAGPRLRVLGATSVAGDLQVALAELDVHFREQAVALSQQGQLLVHGAKVAELPLGEILHRSELIERAVTDTDRALAAQATPRVQLATRFAELMDLQLQGADDPRIQDRAQQLYQRLHSDPAPVSEPPPPAAREQQLSQLDQMLSSIPTLCQITVSGGEAVLGQLAPAGPAGLALAVVMNVIGDEGLSQWLTNRCCEMASSSLMHASTTECHTDADKDGALPRTD